MELTVILHQIKIDKMSSELNIIKVTNGEDLDKYINLYKMIGEKYHWVSRIKWSKDQWTKHVFTETILPFLVKLGTKHIGLIELNIYNSFVYLKYLGILDLYIGNGYSKFLLNFIKIQTKKIDYDTIVLKTRDTDHPNAFKVYIKAGFIISHQEFLLN